MRTLCGTILAAVGVFCTLRAEGLTDLVNPFVGVNSRSAAWRTGSSHPGATWPGGMLQPGPDTGAQWPVRSGYCCDDDCLAGFSQNRQMGTTWACLHDVLMLPFTGDIPQTAPAMKERHLLGMMDKKGERAEPGYYAVSLTNFGVKAELTVSRRVAYHRYTFEKGGPSRVLVDLQSGPLSSWGGERARPPRVTASESRIGPDGVLVGTNVVKCALPSRVVAFAVAFSRPWKAVAELGDNGWPGKRYVFDFDLKPGEAVVAKVALSTVDEDGARRNLAGDPEGFDFDARRTDAHRAWERTLGRVEVDGDDERRKVFYTMLYQAFVHPNLASDVDGRVRLGDGKVYKMDKPFFTGYLDTWDTFRALHPLMTVIAPRRAGLLARTLLEDAKCRGGEIPSCHIGGQSTRIMPGWHGIPIVLDALEKGLLPEYDPAEVLSLAKKSIGNIDLLVRKGWYPISPKWVHTASTQLDQVVDLWCLARAAEAHSLSDGDTARIAVASSSWTNLYDAASGFLRPRDFEGRWSEPFDRWQQRRDGVNPWGFNEGGYAQWAWHVLGEPEKLIALHGGPEKAAADLDGIFNAPEKIAGQKFGAGCSGQMGQYFHGNEPTHHMAYLYGYMGRGKTRTAELVREICTKLYKNTTDGLCGDGDSGQMAAWYVMSSLGFYQVKPVGGEFVLGAPQYPRLKVRLGNGRTLEIVARNFSAKNRHVTDVQSNGRRIESGVVGYRQIMSGGTLEFTMRP